MVNSDDWDEKVFEVRMESGDGKRYWTGEVKVWKRDSGSHGRKNDVKDFKDGDWKQGDKLTLLSCT